MEPYQLKLTFKAALNAEGESNTFLYNKDKQYVACRVEKVNKGEVFDGLDNTQELVKENGGAGGGSEEEEGQEFDKEVLEEGMKEQKELSEKYDKAQLTEEYTYGFNNKYRDTFRG